jgi:hypothetical protein
MQSAARTIRRSPTDGMNLAARRRSGPGHPAQDSNARTHRATTVTLALGLALGVLSAGRAAVGQEQSLPVPNHSESVWNWRRHEPALEPTRSREAVVGAAPSAQMDRREAEAVDQLYRELTGQDPSAAPRAGASPVLTARHQPDVAAAQPPAPAEVPLTLAQIEVVLHVHGYSAIEGLKREGNSFRIHSALRYGEPVGELQADAVTGKVRGERMSEQQARAMLIERGFSEVPKVRREGDTILACGRRDGSELEVRINALTGAVTRQTLEESCATPSSHMALDPGNS